MSRIKLDLARRCNPGFMIVSVASTRSSSSRRISAAFRNASRDPSGCRPGVPPVLARAGIPNADPSPVLAVDCPVHAAAIERQFSRSRTSAMHAMTPSRPGRRRPARSPPPPRVAPAPAPAAAPASPDWPGRIGSPRQPALQVVGQRLGASRSAGRVLLQALQADRLQVAVDPRVERARARPALAPAPARACPAASSAETAAGRSAARRGSRPGCRRRPPVVSPSWPAACSGAM